MPAVAELVHAGHGVSARRLELHELLELETRTPLALEPGGTARVVFAVLDVARRSVAAGLVHPHLEAADGRWHALWGATLDEHVVDELQAIAARDARLPPPTRSRATRARSSTISTPARSTSSHAEALREPRVSLSSASPSHRRASPSGFSRVSPRRHRSFRRTAATRRSNDGSPPGSTAGSRAGRARRGTSACGSTSWTPCPRPTGRRSCSSSGSRPPTTRHSPFRRSCSRPAPTRSSASSATAIRAARSTGGSRRSRRSSRTPALRSTRASPPTRAPLDADQVRAFLRDSMPRLEELGVPAAACRASGSRPRAACASTSSRRALPRARAVCSPPTRSHRSTGGSRSATSSSPRTSCASWPRRRSR